MANEKPMTVGESKANATLEAIKLVLRMYVFTILPFLTTIILMGVNVTTGVIDINWKVLTAVFIFQTVVYIQAGVDKWKHEFTKGIDPIGTEGKSEGIVKF